MDKTDDHQSADPDAWIAEALGWKWPKRYAFGAALTGGLIAFVYWLRPQDGGLSWLIWAVIGLYGLYALAVMREVLYLLLCALGLWVAWYLTKDMSPMGWLVFGGMAMFGYMGHLQSRDSKRLQDQIDRLQQQLNRISGNPWV